VIQASKRYAQAWGTILCQEIPLTLVQSASAMSPSHCQPNPRHPSCIGRFATLLLTFAVGFSHCFCIWTLQFLPSSQCADNMSGARSRLAKLASHFLPASASPQPEEPDAEFKHRHHIHTLSPTFFLARAAQIEPEVSQNFDMTNLIGMRVDRIGYCNLSSHLEQYSTAKNIPECCRSSKRLRLLCQKERV
jgi:hypothetical protein